MQPEEELERKKLFSVWNSNIKTMRDNSVKQTEENSQRYYPLQVIFRITYIQILNGIKYNVPTQENIYRTKQ